MHYMIHTQHSIAFYYLDVSCQKKSNVIEIGLWNQEYGKRIRLTNNYRLVAYISISKSEWFSEKLIWKKILYFHTRKQKIIAAKCIRKAIFEATSSNYYYFIIAKNIRDKNLPQFIWSMIQRTLNTYTLTFNDE